MTSSRPDPKLISTKWIEYLWRRGNFSRAEIRAVVGLERFGKKLGSPGWEKLLRLNLPLLTPQKITFLKETLERGISESSPDAFVTFKDPGFPRKLFHLHDPPCLYYYRGRPELLQRGGPWIAVVGTRRASREALEVTEKLIRQMEPYRPLIVSGMADGIDGRAHRQALFRGMATLGVLGTPLDKVYPAWHRGLFKDMEQQGLLISEVHPRAPMGPWRFPERNRSIAALADAVVVVEAPEKSGALVTARLALELGREIFVVPGPLSHEGNLGGHRLLQQGANLLTSAREIFAVLGVPVPTGGGPEPVEGFSCGEKLGNALEEKIVGILTPGPLHIDKIVHIGHLAAPLVASALASLCLLGKVEELPGGNYKLIQ